MNSQQTQKKSSKRKGTKKVLLLSSLAVTALCLRIAGVDDYLDINRLDELLNMCRNFPPILYILCMTAVPVFFLPGFPFVVLAGLLYGNVLGFFYAMIGASTGAALAFLLSRYIAHQWALKMFGGGKYEKLQHMTKKNGLQVVLILRLIPLFPFTPLNYALGLTSVTFNQYMLATVIGILPACAAFVLFSNSLWQFLHTGATTNLIIGGALVLAVVLLPFLVRRFKTVR